MAEQCIVSRHRFFCVTQAEKYLELIIKCTQKNWSSIATLHDKDLVSNPGGWQYRNL